MRDIIRVYLNLCILCLLFFNIKDEKHILDDSIPEVNATAIEQFINSDFKDRVRLGIKKQSLITLEQNISDPRDL